MPLHLPPELERRIAALAAQTQAVLTDLLGMVLDEDEAFRSEVRAGLAELDGGEGIDHDEAKRRLRAAIEPHGART
jgi:predicted transcriptional regulator